MLKLAYNDGTRHIIATPHFDPVGHCPNVAELKNKLDELNGICDQDFPGLRISLGAEVLFGEGLRRKLRSGAIPTMNGSQYVLVEFLPSVSRDVLEKAVGHLANGGFVSIIAHAERYTALMKDLPWTAYLREKYGALVQVNAAALLRHRHFFAFRHIKNALVQGLVDFVASDAHDIECRKTRMMACYQLVCSRYGIRHAERMFCCGLMKRGSYV